METGGRWLFFGCSDNDYLVRRGGWNLWTLPIIATVFDSLSRPNGQIRGAGYVTLQGMLINTWYEGRSALPHTRDWLLVNFRGMLFKSVDRDRLELIPEKFERL